MSITLAAVFESDSEAQEACRKLEKAGIDEQSIRVTPSSPSISAAEPEDHRGFIQKLFSLGDDETSSGTYLEAVSRGNPVVTVQLIDESRVDKVSDILDDCGAIDIDERVEQWKASGYEPPVPARPMPAGDDSRTMTSVDEQMKAGKRGVRKGRAHAYRTMTESPVPPASMHEFSGAERRHGPSGSYNGPERRAGL